MDEELSPHVAQLWEEYLETLSSTGEESEETHEKSDKLERLGLFTGVKDKRQHVGTDLFFAATAVLYDEDQNIVVERHDVPVYEPLHHAPLEGDNLTDEDLALLKTSSLDASSEPEETLTENERIFNELYPKHKATK